MIKQFIKPRYLNLNKKRTFISFYLVLSLFLIVTIIVFILMLHISNVITSNINQQVSLLVSSIGFRNINSLLASKSENYNNLEFPIIDLLIAATFFDKGYSEIEDMLYKTKEAYNSKYSVNFGYCTDFKCTESCKEFYNIPTAYGDLIICNLEFNSTFGYGKECGTQ